MSEEVKDEEGAVEEAAEETTESKFVDSSVVMKTIPQRIPDEKLLEIAEVINEKQFRVIELKNEISIYTSGRKGTIKELEEQLDPLVHQFHEKTENVSKEVKLTTDFDAGKVRIESLDGELISEEDMNPTGYQREFAALMEGEPGKELLQKATEAIVRYLAEDREEDEVVTNEMLQDQLCSDMDLSDALAERTVTQLRTSGVVRGRGYPGFEFTVVDPEEEKAAELEQSEELTEEQIREAVEAVIECNRASTSMLQRKLKAGYNWAARLMDVLEERGVIGPVAGDAPREVMFESVEDYEESFVVNAEFTPTDDEPPEEDD